MAETETRQTGPASHQGGNGTGAAQTQQANGSGAGQSGGGKAPAAEPGPPSSTGASTATPFWRRPLFLIILIAIFCAGIVFGVRYWRFASTHVSTDDAAVTGDMVQISPQVTGTVTKVYVQENQIVKTGDLLVTLDDATYKAAVAQAQADLDMAIAQAKGAGANVTLTRETGGAQQVQAQGMVEQADSAIAGAQADVARSEAEIAGASAGARSAEANVANAAAAVNAAIDDKRRFGDAVKAAQAQVETARAGVRAARAAVDAAAAAADRAERDAKRYATLAAQGAVSAQQSEQAATTARAASAQLENSRQQVAEAQATVTQRQADLSVARRQYARADAAIDEARAQLAAAREQQSAASAGIRQQQAARTAALQAVHAAEARRQQAVGQLQQAKTTPRQVAVSESARSQATAKVEQARAALEAAQIKLRETKIYAPVAGQVTKKTISIGTLVQPGAPLMAIVKPTDIWVVANFKETQLQGVRVGNHAEVDVDALPGKTFRGHVESLSAATGATFALLPPDNATGNFTKVVQRVPVKIFFEQGQPDLDLLRGGMSVTATVETK